jgi:predicted ATPase/class 3 adenylate cyclase
MNNAPSGIVTFLFTDIEGSLKLALEHPDDMPDLLARHHQILNQSVQTHHGYVFQIIGDAFCVAFSSAIEALNAAVDAQRFLQNEAWTPAPIKVRMGIHTGTAQLRDNGQYSGYATLASSQLIMSAGYGGQILLSGATRDLVRDMLPKDVELLDLGERRLKELLRPEHLYQLNLLGLPSTFPLLKTLDSFPNNLPPQLTTFIGRENEIAEVKHELTAHRLVTLTGPGGTGKTRLSLQVATDLLDRFDHGVWLVELAPLADPDLIPQTILSTVGINEQQGKTPLEILKEYLREKKALIVLDNCEHLIEASAKVINTLLNAAPNLRILVTSREALGVKGELSYPVPSLSLPDPKHLPVLEQLSQSEAVRLFIDRAFLVAPHFAVTKENASSIAQICCCLDGIPLAIELAAARLKILTVHQISSRLDDRFRLLTGGARTAVPRQQTLRALIDWSYDLLSENERLLLRRLSVFAGGCTLEAAEEVCSDQSPVNSEQADRRLLVTDILDLLTQLVNKSLVVVVAEGSRSGEARYRMLETIRQYAREKLLEVGRDEIVLKRHLAYFVKLAEQAEPELYRSNQVFWLNKLDDEIDNLRTALEWALATDTESGLRIAAFPRQFWKARSYTQEAGKWLAQLLEHYDKADSLRIQALITYSLCVEDNTQSRIVAEQSLQIARVLSDKLSEAHSLLNIGLAISRQGYLGEGLPYVEQSLSLFQALGDKLGQAEATFLLSRNHNDLEHSKALVVESLRLYRQLGHLWGIATSLKELAFRAIRRGDFSLPLQWLEEARGLYRQLGDQGGEASVLEYHGTLAFWTGDYQQAFSYYEQSIVLNEEIGDYNNDWARVNMAYTRLRQGNLAEAIDIFELCIQHFQKANTVIGLVYTLEGLASLYVIQDQPERAAQLFAWADGIREKIDDRRPPLEQASVDKDLEVIHSRVNDAEFAKLSAEGRGMTTEQAIAFGLKESQ